MSMFKPLGLLVALYAVYAAVTGAVVVKSGVWGKRVLRDETPGEFWRYIALYAALAVAVLLFF